MPVAAAAVVALLAAAAVATDTNDTPVPGATAVPLAPLVTDPPPSRHTGVFFAVALGILLVVFGIVLSYFAYHEFLRRQLAKRSAIQRGDSEYGEQTLAVARSGGAVTDGSLPPPGLEQPAQTPAARDGWKLLSGDGGVPANDDGLGDEDRDASEALVATVDATDAA